MRHRIHGKGRAAHRAVVIVLAAAGTAAAAPVKIIAPAATAKATKAAEAATTATAATATAVLSVDFNGGAKQGNQDAAEKFFVKICFHKFYMR
jgi:hypothetical protein